MKSKKNLITEKNFKMETYNKKDIEEIFLD